MNMKRNSLLGGALTMFLAASAVLADHHESRVLTWAELQKDGKLLGGQIQPAGENGWQSLKIANTGSDPLRYPIVTFDSLSPTSNDIAIEGQIKYQNIAGQAYLEMWTILPDGRRFFTRTLAEGGPLQKITGTSAWRIFSLPFSLSGESPKHVALEVNAFLPGPGTIELGPLRIVNLSPEPPIEPNIWWSNQIGGWIGGVLGMAIGLMMAAVAILLQKSAPSKPIAAILLLVVTISFLCLMAGIAAVIKSQPYVVYYPLLLAGVMAAAFALVGYVKLRRRLRELELRKIQAMDT
jgi:hypothetical protein